MRDTERMWWKRPRDWAVGRSRFVEPISLEVRPGQPLPLLLWTDYGCGPLWRRSPDNTAAGGISPSSLPLSESLCVRLQTWTEGDYHLWSEVVLGYNFDDPAYDRAWHDEGLALLTDLRSELGPHFDIKFKHDLEA